VNYVQDDALAVDGGGFGPRRGWDNNQGQPGDYSSLFFPLVEYCAAGLGFIRIQA
jgi:hypothetical protein